MKSYTVSIWTKVNPYTGKYCKPYVIRFMRVHANSFGDVIRKVFVGNCESVGRISENGTDNFEG